MIGLAGKGTEEGKNGRLFGKMSPGLCADLAVKLL
jgi:hypothetical protein